MTFSSKHCQIQDIISLNMNGLPKLHDGLYFLQIPGQKACMNIIEFGIPENGNCSEDVWHHKLWHPLDKVLRYISDTHPYVPFKQNTIYDTCHYAKQHKLPFLHSDNRSNHIFNMIHVDIWGLFLFHLLMGIDFSWLLLMTIVVTHGFFLWEINLKLYQFYPISLTWYIISLESILKS